MSISGDEAELQHEIFALLRSGSEADLLRREAELQRPILALLRSYEAEREHYILALLRSVKAKGFRAEEILRGLAAVYPTEKRRGRPRKDDAQHIGKMRRLVAQGMTSSAAAAAVADTIGEGNSARTRALRLKSTYARFEAVSARYGVTLVETLEAYNWLAASLKQMRDAEYSLCALPDALARLGSRKRDRLTRQEGLFDIVADLLTEILVRRSKPAKSRR